MSQFVHYLIHQVGFPPAPNFKT